MELMVGDMTGGGWRRRAGGVVEKIYYSSDRELNTGGQRYGSFCKIGTYRDSLFASREYIFKLPEVFSSICHPVHIFKSTTILNK